MNYCRTGKRKKQKRTKKPNENVCRYSSQTAGVSDQESVTFTIIVTTSNDIPLAAGGITLLLYESDSDPRMWGICATVSFLMWVWRESQCCCVSAKTINVVIQVCINITLSDNRGHKICHFCDCILWAQKNKQNKQWLQLMKCTHTLAKVDQGNYSKKKN